MVEPELTSLLMACSRQPEDRVAKLVTADWAQEHNMASLEWLMRSMAESPPDWTVFIGSRRYGTPRPDSDFDWVVPYILHRPSELNWFSRKFFPKKTVNDEFLIKVADEVLNDVQLMKSHPYQYVMGNRVTKSARFGPVNILLSPYELVDSWERAAMFLEIQRPVTREFAITTMEITIRFGTTPY